VVLLVVAAFYFLKKDQRISQPPDVGSNLDPLVTSNKFAESLPSSLRQTSAKVSDPHTTNSVANKISALGELSLRNDPESFQEIISQLSDPTPAIRKAALEATIQFGDRAAIPILKELASKTEDAREKLEILDAAEFLAMPTLTEVRAQRRTNSGSNSIRRP